MKMRALAAPPGWAGPSTCPSQPCFGTFRRPTAVPLRLYRQHTPFLGVTHQGSSPPQTQDELEAVEEAMRAAKPGNGTSTGAQHSDGTKSPAQLALVEAEALKKEFLKVKEEVSKYQELCKVKKQQQDEIDRLQQEKVELEGKLAALQGEADAKMKELLQAREKLELQKDDQIGRLEQEKAALEGLLAAQRDDQQRVVEAARIEVVEPLRRQLEELSGQVSQREEQLVSLVAQHQSELEMAVETARKEAAEEAAGPLQQQLEELSMQLQNSQAQLERLGEAVETAEAGKMVAVQALRDENQQLLLALESAIRRLAEVMYPPGSLPAGVTVSTRLEGNVDLQALLAQQKADAAAVSAAAAAAAVAATAVTSPEASPAASPKAETSSSGRAPQQQLQQPQQLQAQGPSGLMGWLFGLFRVSLYQGLGFLLLYYAASILRGMPPELNLAFAIGCVAVSTLLSWTNHLLFLRFAA